MNPTLDLLPVFAFWDNPGHLQTVARVWKSGQNVPDFSPHEAGTVDATLDWTFKQAVTAMEPGEGSQWVLTMRCGQCMYQQLNRLHEGGAEKRTEARAMKKKVVRRVLIAALFTAFAAGSMIAVTPVTSAAGKSCEQECFRDYRACVPFCSKNPCFVSCETVLEICLSNCESES